MKKKPRITYVERGVITMFQGTPWEQPSKVGYVREGAPKNAPMLTKEEARANARRQGAVATFRRIS